jgi:hypothetical protein
MSKCSKFSNLLMSIEMRSFPAKLRLFSPPKNEKSIVLNLLDDKSKELTFPGIDPSGIL